MTDKKNPVAPQNGGRSDSTPARDTDLRRPDRRLRDMAESAADWFWEADADLRLTDISRAGAAGTQPGPPDLIGLPIEKLPFTMESVQERDRLWAMLRAHTPFRDIELSGRYGEGQRHVIRISGKPIIAETGEFSGYRGIATDVTSSLAARGAARLGERRFHAMFEAEPACVALIAAGGTLEDINPACARLLGSSRRDQTIGRHLLDIVTTRSRAEVEKALAHAFAGEVTTLDCQVADLHGQTHWLEATMAPIGQPDGPISHCLLIARDATLQRFAQQQLQEAHRLEAVGRLTGGVAHDFNNILTIIIGNTELLLERLAADPESHRLAEITMSAARTGADLIRMLLSYSRRQPLQPSEFSVDELLQEIGDLIRRSVGEHIELVIVAAEDTWGVTADRTQLASVLLNLALNARDAMPKGGRLQIETRNVHLNSAYVAANPGATEGDYVVISVADSGSGIAPELIDRVFEPFFTTKDAGKGSGLGLSMVYGFARQAGGHVKISSEERVGTTVRLYLPRSQIQLRLPNMETTLEAATARDGETVLVVEDNAGVRANVATQLDSLGYTVHAMADARSALEMLATLPRVDLL